MTVAQAVMFLMQTGWRPVAPGEAQVAPTETTERQCGACLRWRPSLRESNYRPTPLCEDCRTGRTRHEDVVQPRQLTNPITTPRAYAKAATA